MRDLSQINYLESFEEWLEHHVYPAEVNALNLIAVGLEAFEILVQLKVVFPHLNVGYMYHEDLGYLPDWNGNLVADNFTYIPIISDVNSIGRNYYRIKTVDTNSVHKTLNYLNKDVVVFGALTDPILVKLMSFYEFNHLRLLLRRPLFSKNSSLRDAINKHLWFSKLPSATRVIDTNKIYRYIKRLGDHKLLAAIHEETMSHWFVHLIQLLDLPDSDYFGEPRLRLEACLF